MSTRTLTGHETILDIKGEPVDRRYARILKAFGHLMTVRSYYSPEHEQYVAASRKACAVIVESIGDQPAILIEIGSEGMMLGGQTVEAGHREVRQLHELLVPLNIARLEIGNGLTPGDLRTALHVFHDYRLKLGASSSFQEINIEGLPDTIRTIGCRLFTQDKQVADEDETGTSATGLTRQLLDLVGEIVANLGAAAKGQAASGRRADLQDLSEALKKLAGRESDPFSLLQLIQNAQKALEISRDPGSVDLVFRMLRKELGKPEPAITRAAPARQSDPQQEEKSLADLRSHLAETISAATRSGDPDPSDSRGDFLGICFKILSAEPSAVLKEQTLAALETALSSPSTGAGEIRICANWSAETLQNGHRETGQDILASLLKSLRTAHLDLLPTFWVTLWGLLGDEAHGDIWPLLVNDVLLGTGDTPTEVKRSLLAAVGSVDLDTARSVRQRLFDLPAFRRRHASGAIFTVHPSRLLVLHAMMLESPLATWHGPRLQKLLLRSAPGDLLGIVVRLIGDFRRENSPLIIGLLEHTGENTLPDRLKETVTMLLADGLGMLAPRDRDQDWVVHGLEWLDRLDHEAAKPVFRRVLHDRRLLFFRAWPARCRTAVERMVQEWNNTSVT